MANEKPLLVMEVPSDDDEFFAYVLTLFLKAFEPGLDEATAYPIVLDMVFQGLTEESATYYGEALQSVVATSSKKKKQKEKRFH